MSGWSISGATSENTDEGVLYWEYTGTSTPTGAYGAPWTETGDDGNLVSNLVINGADDTNTNSGQLYWTLNRDTEYTEVLFRLWTTGVHTLHTDVATTGWVSAGAGKTISEAESSGLSGSVDLIWPPSVQDTDAGNTITGTASYDTSLTLSLYSDSAKTQLVAQGTASALGEITLTAQNDSGLSGTVTADSLGTDTDAGNTLTGNSVPTLSSTVPIDNATDVSVSPTLTLTFSETVSKTGTGYLTIYKTSDDSVIEQINTATGSVTGSGTDTITVTPTVTLSASTQYYILIDAMAFYDEEDISYAGITDSTVWSFTTAAASSSSTGGGSSTYRQLRAERMRANWAKSNATRHPSAPLNPTPNPTPASTPHNHSTGSGSTMTGALLPSLLIETGQEEESPAPSVPPSPPLSPFHQRLLTRLSERINQRLQTHPHLTPFFERLVERLLQRMEKNTAS